MKITWQFGNPHCNPSKTVSYQSRCGLFQPPSGFLRVKTLKITKNLSYLQHWQVRVAHKRNICKPRNCDVLDLNTYIRWGASFSVSSPPQKWFPGWGPSSKQPLSQPPNFSTTIVERKREWPVTTEKKKLVDGLKQLDIWVGLTLFPLGYFPTNSPN